MRRDPGVSAARWLRSVFEDFARNTFYFGPLFVLRNVRLYLPGSGPYVTVKIPRHGNLWVRPKDSDFEVVQEILGTHEYDLSRFAQYGRIQERYEAILRNGKTPLIVDAGAYIGVSSMVFSDQFPKAKVLAVEPNPANARLCARNTATHPNIRTIEAALGGRPGRALLDTSADPFSWGVRTERIDGGNVEVLTIPQLIETEGDGVSLFLVKIDIEGFEKDVFEGDTGWTDQPAAIVVEIHDWMLPGKATSRALLRHMASQEREVLISGENLIFVKDAERSKSLN